MRKKIFSIIILNVSFCLLMFIISACNSVDDEVSNTPIDNIEYSQNLAYTISEDESYYIVRGIGLCSDRDIFIPPTYNQLPVLEIGDNAFEKEQISSVFFTKNIRKIGVKAFSECNNLSKIVFGDNLETISSYAFYKCENLEEITFGCNDLSIDSYAFYWCEKLSTISIKNAISIGSHAFSECHNLSAVQISSKIDFLSETAFNGCNKLTYNTYDNCTYLGNDDCRYLVLFKADNQSTSCTVFNGTRIILPNAFKNNNSLKMVSLPTTLIRIGYSAFENCKSLLSIDIPQNVISIGKCSFQNCESLTRINYHAINCSDISSEMFKGAGVSNDGIDVIIGSRVEQIPAQLFAVDFDPIHPAISPNITSLSFENDSVCKSIGALAFSGLFKLTSVLFPDSLTNIEGGAFRDCYNLTSVTIGINVKDIAPTAFENCYKLIEVLNKSNFLNISTSSSDNGYIGYYAKNIYKSPEDSKIKYDNSGCITYVDGQTTIFVNYIGNSSYVNIPEGVTEVGDYAFYCTSIETVTIPNTVNKIGCRAFYKTGLTYIKIPSSVNSLGAYVFMDCSYLTGIEFEDRTIWYHTTNKEAWLTKEGGTYIVPYENPNSNVSSFTYANLYSYHYWYKIDD